jgi:hypothetical protein
MGEGGGCCITATMLAGGGRLVKARWHSLAEETDDSGKRKVAMPAKGRWLCWQKEGGDATKDGSDGAPNGGGNAGKGKVVMLVK